MMFKNITIKKFNKLLAFLKHHSNIVYITKTIGKTNLEFEVELRSNTELHEFMNELIYKFSDILKNYKTSFDFKEIKIDYFPKKYKS